MATTANTGRGWRPRGDLLDRVGRKRWYTWAFLLAAVPLVTLFALGVGIQYVFQAFAAVAVVGGLTVAKFGIETKGRVLEELSP